MWLVIAVLLAPVLLYIPFVQNAVKDFALRQVAKSTGMVIGLDHFRLSWPLRIQAEGLLIVPAPGDTMVTARDIRLQVEPLPLIMLDIRAHGDMKGVRYRMGTPDSLMYIDCLVDKFDLDPSGYNLRTGRITVSRASLDGADMTLLINGTDTTATPPDSASQSDMLITADRLVLRNVRYRMSMMPVIDSLGVEVPLAELSHGRVDMLRREIHARSLSIDSVSAAYLTPSLAYLHEHPATPSVEDSTASADSTMWTITGESVTLTARHALYATRDAAPQPGFDPSYIEGHSIAIAIDSLYNRGASIRVPLRRFEAVERCGLKLDAAGLFDMDSTRMLARGFHIATLHSSVDFDALMGMGDMASDPTLPVDLSANAAIGLPDIIMAMPAMAPALASIPRERNLQIEADMHGTTGNLDVERIKATMRGAFDMDMKGRVISAFDPDRLSGDIDISGRIIQPSVIKPIVLPGQLARTYNIPPLTLDGEVEMRAGDYTGSLQAVTGAGRLALDGTWRGHGPAYSLDLALDSFPVAAFAPALGIGPVTAHVTADGYGLDFMKRATTLQSTVDLNSVIYQGATYNDIRMEATLDSGIVNAGIISLNHDADFNLELSGDIAADTMDVSWNGEIRNLNLQALHLTDSLMGGRLDIGGNARVNLQHKYYDARMSLTDLNWDLNGTTLRTPRADMAMMASDTTFSATVTNGDLSARMLADCSLDTLLTRLSGASSLISGQIEHRRFYVDSIQQALPRIAVDIESSGPNSLLGSYLGASDITVRRAALHMLNDSLITMRASATGISTKTMRIDTVTLNAFQHGPYLLFTAQMDNAPGTFDDFAYVKVNGFVGDNSLAASVSQKNISGDTGYRIGANLTMTDSLMTLRMMPLNPVIGYKNWTLNSDNLISYNPQTRHLHANLDLSSGDSHLRLVTLHHDDQSAEQEAVSLSASGIELSDWMQLSPFAPPVGGIAGADLLFNWNSATKSLEGEGNVTLDNLTYGDERVGSFNLGVELSTSTTGVIHASTSLMIDSVKVITAVGSLNDSTKTNPFNLDFSMIHLPLRIVNPFLPPGMATVDGMLNGRMDITGTLAAPVFNGYLDFDTTGVKVNMIGTRLKFSENPIPVDSNIVKFENFTITGCNANPLTINGTVDMHSLTDPKIDLRLKAADMMIVDSRRGSGADIYGRGNINLNATVRGNMRFMAVNTSLDLLSGSNLTYVMSSAGSDIKNLQQGSDDMVHFVSFADTIAMEQADTIAATGMAMMLEAKLGIQQGTTLNVDISPNGSDRAQIQGQGNLTFTMPPYGDMRLTGRFNINGGFVRYTPPLMSEKMFNFRDGSYVAFNGDVMNPQLNIHAYDEVRANVTQEGQNSRLINFIVGLSVTNTLENMNVAFDLSTNDDITVQNELQAMSAEQRANQAMNMLLYNVYTGPNTKASANLSGNPLFSFLTSKLNSWAANNIKGVDISFGIDQYERTFDGSTSTATSYSYKVSKTLWNDRIKIIIGGNYSTDANTDENFSQNLINDISFEYMLNRAGSMYVRLFRHVGYESILEGEVTQTGVGFVYRRKLQSLRDLLRRRRQPAVPSVELPEPPHSQAQPQSQTREAKPDTTPESSR